MAGYVASRLNLLEALIKTETTYGTDATPSATTDAVWLAQPGNSPNIMPDTWGFSGDNGPNSVGLQPRLYSSPSQRSGSIDLSLYFRGAGAAYAAGVTPLDGFHTILKACGYTATGSFTSSAETWTYAPTGDGTTPTSATIYAYGRQIDGTSNFRKSVLTGAMGSLKVASSDLKPPLWTASFKGIYPSDPTEATYTAPTLTSGVIAPNGNLSAATIDGTTLKVYSWAFDAGRDLSSERVYLNATGGHAGFVSAGYKPTLKITIEDEKFSTFNPYTKLSSKASVAVVLTIGSTQYNKVTLNVPQGQIIGVTPSGKGSIGTYDLDIICQPSTYAGNDSHSIVAA